MDGYDTAYTERLHIDYVKDTYKASNHRDEYPQMIDWLERQEKVHVHSLFIKWRLDGQPSIAMLEPPTIPKHLHIKIARFPNLKSVAIDSMPARFGAANFRMALSQFIVRLRHPNLNRRQTAQVAASFRLPFTHVPVYFNIKFWSPNIQGLDNIPETLDTAHVRPAYRDTQDHSVAGRFDTVLINEEGQGEDVGVEGILSTNSRGDHALTSI